MSSKPNKKKILLSAKRILEDKKALHAYMNGEITLGALNDKGIKVTMPV